MNRAIFVALGTGTLIASAAALSIGAAQAPGVQSIGRSQFEAALAEIESARVQVFAQCEEASASTREVCRAEAGADELRRVADLEANFRRTQDSARNAQRARIEARYQVERAKCAALGGFKKDHCLIKVHATRGRALLEIAAPYEVRS